MRIILAALISMIACAANAATPAHWVIVPEKTTIEFTAMNAGAPIKGEFTKVIGTVDFAPEALAQSKASIEVDISSLRSADKDAAESLPTIEWLDAKSFSTAKFEAMKFQKTGNKTYTAAGNLTLRGVTKPVSVAFMLESYEPKPGGVAAITGTATLKRTEFGVGQGEWKSTDAVADAVTLTIKAVASYTPAK